ncbi:GNAT family N-acetyltransferase [Streptomyces sp. NPDC000348]|uniref:GNAT family N-acetyltransferase n=1 Tax=Streptomyces sp. NPDC000348 TaxID=3364538 RepID=UPI0036D1A693
MSGLRIEAVAGDAVLEQWRHVHNVIVPPAAMTLDEVRERVTRGYRLENAYAGDVLVGCSTVRPPQGADAVVTVIARVLPEHRRRGYGAALCASGIGHARGGRRGRRDRGPGRRRGRRPVRSRARGFDEVERYVLPGESELWLTLRPAPFPSWTGGWGGAAQRFPQSCGNPMCAVSRSS